MFSLEYPKLEDYLVSFENGIVPMLQTIDPSLYFQTQEESTFRLSPNVRSFIGDYYKGDFILTIAATAQSLVQSIEDVRSCLEVLISEMIDDKTFPIDSIIKERQIIEENICMLAPVIGQVDEKETIQWYQRLEELISQAENEEIQPEEAIPWF
ncbi:hypothetical protein GPJ56_000632 [Histomonas meleagridis]|uniref:uncharacterized protein n=1 Tax=Histomonas meleagridis TaxID=135588 RepID=UPI0035596180|nr:hypothetical protein GPJ56_000632 [Histomonas meleagridis]KAH0804759.1 hypothetical protein GO595_002453 [Histomonas meleagridis]